MEICMAGTSNQLFYKVLKLKQNFWKNEVVTGKTLAFVIGPFILPTVFVLTLTSDRAVLYGNAAFSSVLLLKVKVFTTIKFPVIVT